MKTMKIVIPGNPIPKARARTGKGFAYDPQYKLKKQVTKFLQQHVREFYSKSENAQEGYKLAHGEAFEVNWYFHMPIPKSFNQTKRNACKWGLIEHTTKPDRSNLEKFYEDCANDVLWKDDCQIIRGEIVKKYCNDDKPRTEIIMKAIKGHNEEVTNIVSLFSPQEINSIVEDANSLSSNETTLFNVANFISKLADNHANKLSKIKKTYPGHWKKLDSNSNFI
jgi:Holliday junction resolvase RusA-like endonuclease